MKLETFDNPIDVNSAAELDRLLRSIRHGPYGAFILWHTKEGAFLWIHTNLEVAYVHFFLDFSGRSCGFQPTSMTPAGCPELVHFLQVNGTEGDSIDLTSEAVVSVETSYRAAQEFFQQPVLPASISWFEL